MKYIKKVCLLQEQTKGFSSCGKSLDGMVKCEQISGEVKIELSILNLAPPKEDNYLLFIGNSAKNCALPVKNGFCNLSSSTEILDVSLPFACALILENSQKVVLFGKTVDYAYSQADFFNLYKQKSLTTYLEEENVEKQIDELFYADDIVATENYYEKEDVDLKTLSLKELENEKLENVSLNKQNIKQEKEQKTTTSPCQDERDFCSFQEIEKTKENSCKDTLCENNPSENQPCESCNDEDCPSLTEFADMLSPDDNQNFEDFCASEDVENLLNSYPRFPELENAIYKSKWVKISLEDCEYYFGKATLGEEIYLCYAVKGEEGACPKELEKLSTFIPSPYEKNIGYYVMFQKEK